MFSQFNLIHRDFKTPEKWRIGSFNLIEKGVSMGEENNIKNYVEIREGTRIGDRNLIDSRVSFSGGPSCVVGDDCKLRFGVVVARFVLIRDNVFLAPGVKFIYIPFTGTARAVPKPTIVEPGVKIGVGSVIGDGVHIPEDTIIGALSFVRKSIEKKGVYGGNPLRRIR